MKFKKKLVEGYILQKKNRFIATVSVGDEIVECHIPTTGRIGNINLSNLSCLLSESDNPKRKTKFTIEAISFDILENKQKDWIGINQIAVNGFVEYFFKNNCFDNIEKIKSPSDIKREVKLLNSKIDFKVGNCYLEVKTPLQQIQIKVPNHVTTNKVKSFNSTDRFVKHISDLSSNLINGEKAILLLCFVYDNPGFKIIHKSDNYSEVQSSVNDSLKKGLEIWQANFKISEYGVELKKYHPLKLA